MNQRTSSSNRIDNAHFDWDPNTPISMEQNAEMNQKKQYSGDTLLNLGVNDQPPTTTNDNSLWGNIVRTVSINSGTPNQKRFKKIGYVIFFVLLLVLVLSNFKPSTSISTKGGVANTLNTQPHQSNWYLNNERTDYVLTAVADRDSFSFDSASHTWKSVLLYGKLTRDKSTGLYTVEWDIKGQVPLKGKLAEQKRGLELSELKRFNGKLHAFDDRTGIVYELIPKDHSLVARHILSDGDGTTPKGFKCEWATVKDNKLYVGSIGKEWTTGDGVIIGKDPMWVKTIDTNGRVEHIDWVKNYEALRDAVGANYPGYMVHEAAEWNDFHKRWFFLPRRVSTQKYDENEDVKRGSNYILSASEDFLHITYKTVGVITPTRGFSSFKFIPGRPNEIIAVKSEEIGEEMQSFVTVFNLDGKVLMEETRIAGEKIEGIEIQ
ncbi:calcium-activated nucleotidase [Acrasis kona]|uniref:Calcium-activated nucleotidase n=1 Tax=Acrasis kona TaxID=1008807 RepID=A0AAW2YIY1_9EUKA